VVAVAHTLAHLIYHVLATREPYSEKRGPVLDSRQKERIIRDHVRRLGKLGVTVYGPLPAPRHPHKRGQDQPQPPSEQIPSTHRLRRR
jgi:hypothetical protein